MWAASRVWETSHMSISTASCQTCSCTTLFGFTILQCFSNLAISPVPGEIGAHKGKTGDGAERRRQPNWRWKGAAAGRHRQGGSQPSDRHSQQNQPKWSGFSLMSDSESFVAPELLGAPPPDPRCEQFIRLQHPREAPLAPPTAAAVQFSSPVVQLCRQFLAIL